MSEQPNYQPPPPPTYPLPARPQTSSLASMGSFITAVGILAGLGAVVSGIALAIHKVTTCTNPFDASLCDTTTHPFVGAGIGLIVGGIIEAIVICTVGHLCKVVAGQRAALARAGIV